MTVKEVMYPSYKGDQVGDRVKEVMYPSYKKDQLCVMIREIKWMLG